MKKTGMILCGLIVGVVSCYAQATRTVKLGWTASVTAGVTGYNVYRAPSGTGPQTQLNTGVVTGTTFDDLTAQIGSIYTYWVTAVTTACTPTTPVGTPCGESSQSLPTATTVPPRPAVTVSVTVAVQ